MVIDFSSFYDFPREVEKLFDDVARLQDAGHRRGGFPAINIAEDDHNYYVEICVPGIDPKEIDLTLTDKSLVIRGERKPQEGRYLRNERGTGSFQRILSLNVPVERDKVHAHGQDGILQVVLPKAESVKPRKIAITRDEAQAIDV